MPGWVKVAVVMTVNCAWLIVILFSIFTHPEIPVKDLFPNWFWAIPPAAFVSVNSDVIRNALRIKDDSPESRDGK